MKITGRPDMVRGSGNASSIGGVIIGPPGPGVDGGRGIVSSSSNAASWQPIISTITVGGTVLLGPNVAIAAGSNISLSVSSNTATIHTTLAFGSNVNSVGPANVPGASPLITAADHVHLGVTSVAHTSNTFSGPVTVVAGANIGITSPASGTLTISGAAAGGGGGSSGGLVFKRTVIIGTGDKTTTSSTKVAMDTTNLGYLTLDLVVGDVVRCTLAGHASHSTTQNIGYDFEVDQPTSANVFVADAAEWGVAISGNITARRAICAIGLFTATEAGVHGFRPAWKTNAATASFYNATSGFGDTAISFMVEKLGQPTA